MPKARSFKDAPFVCVRFSVYAPLKKLSRLERFSQRRELLPMAAAQCHLLP